MDKLRAFQWTGGQILSIGVLALSLAGAGNENVESAAGAVNDPVEQVAGAVNDPVEQVVAADKDPASAEKKKQPCVAEDPVNCASYATDVLSDGDGAPFCKRNPGVSKKCNAQGLQTNCPFSYGPYKCKTVLNDAQGNCKCACQG